LPSLSDEPWSEERVDWLGRTYRQREIHFRFSEKAPAKRSNGADWKCLASQSARKWWRGLQDKNQGFFKHLERKCHDIKYDTNNGPKSAFSVSSDGDFAHNIFVYASVQQREWCSGGAASPTPGAANTYDYGTWHCDGGPSTVFCALGLDGARQLQAEASDGSVFTVDLPAGSFYISSPSGFWHTVEPIFTRDCTTTTQTSLIMRSACLLRRISGGRHTVNKDGMIKSSSGMPYATKSGFELLCRQVCDTISTVLKDDEFRL